ncbi:hypothetical protein V2J09_009774, partial [Rumex salicifolius]
KVFLVCSDSVSRVAASEGFVFLARPLRFLIYFFLMIVFFLLVLPVNRVYGAASGQQVNFAKSELSFSKSVDGTQRLEVQAIFHVREVDKHERYLGLPTRIGKAKKVIFEQVKERILQKVRRWSSRNLPRAGKEVLIKYVAHVIPNYTMSYFKLLGNLCYEIE